MTTLRIIVDDGRAGMLKNLLQEISFVKSVEEEPNPTNQFDNGESALERIKKIQQEIGDKNLFKEIKDPVEWQREIRKG